MSKLSYILFQQMKVFLLDMSKSKVNKDALDNCGILEYTENYDDSVEVVHAVNDVTEKINDEIEIETETDATTTVTQESPTTKTPETTTTTTIHELPGERFRVIQVIQNEA